MNSLNSIQAQPADPVQSIRDLRNGYLIVRIPAFKAKIDTLRAIVSRIQGGSSQKRLKKQLRKAIEERDTMTADYIRAFRDVYNFSKVAYYFDYEGRDPGFAHYYKLDGDSLTKEEINLKPVFYLYFERTKESFIDALVIHNAALVIIPAPFPNNFMRGGINYMFVKLSAKTFPEWRVGRMNKKLFKYWNENRE